MLWITRDLGDHMGVLWSGDAPTDGPRDWRGDHLVCHVGEEIGCLPKPGTCQRLYTQSEFRRAVATAAQDSVIARIREAAFDYLQKPTGANWSALAKAIGLEECQ